MTKDVGADPALVASQSSQSSLSRPSGFDPGEGADNTALLIVALDAMERAFIAVDEQHAEPTPMKYVTPWQAIANLRETHRVLWAELRKQSGGVK